MEINSDTFERPEDATTLSIAAHELTPVSGYIPHEGRWAVETWSERMDLGQQDAHGPKFTAYAVLPVDWRCALMMLMAGPDAYLDDEGADEESQVLAERLWAHHRLVDDG